MLVLFIVSSSIHKYVAWCMNLNYYVNDAILIVQISQVESTIFFKHATFILWYTTCIQYRWSIWLDIHFDGPYWPRNLICHYFMLTSINNSYLTVIGMHEMHGRMHDNYFVGIVDPLAYFMMTHPLPMALQKLWLLGNYQQAILLATQYDDEIISIKISITCTLYIRNIMCVYYLCIVFPIPQRVFVAVPTLSSGLPVANLLSWPASKGELATCTCIL